MQHRFTARFFTVMTVLTVLCFGTCIGVLQSRIGAGNATLAAKKLEKETLEYEVSQAREEYDYCRSDDYIIRTARDELQMIFPGEIRYTEE